MTDDFRESFKNILDYIPLILALGTISGFGGCSFILGWLVLSVILFVFNFKSKFSCYLSIPIIIFLISSSVLVGSQIFPLLFLSGLFIILLSFFKINFSIPNIVSKSFISSCYFIAVILSFSLILGDKVYPSITLIPFSNTGFFENVNPSSIILAAFTLTVYYCLNKTKINFLPKLFLSVYIAGTINCIYKLNLPCINTSLKSLTIYTEENTLNAVYFIFLSLIIAFIFIAHTKSSLKILKINSKKTFIGLGLSNCISSLFGGITSAPYFIKNNQLIEIIVLLIFAFLFKPISCFIPIAAVGTVLLTECFKCFLRIIKSIKPKNLKSKIIFISCFLTCLYNIIIGVSISGIITLFVRKDNNGKKN